MNHGQDPTQSPEVDHCLLKAKPGCTNRLCVALINPQWVLRRRKTRMGGLNLHWAGAQTLETTWVEGVEVVSDSTPRLESQL